jgi:hypothetical protein
MEDWKYVYSLFFLLHHLFCFLFFFLRRGPFLSSFPLFRRNRPYNPGYTFQSFLLIILGLIETTCFDY